LKRWRAAGGGAGASAKPDSATQRYAALRDAVILHSTTQMGPSLEPATDATTAHYVVLRSAEKSGFADAGPTQI
jgi:hypothetical protein